MVVQLLASLIAAVFSGAGTASVAPVESVDGDFRYRVESVRQDGFAEDALASTLRVRIGLRSKDWHGLHAYAGFEEIRAVGDDRYNSTANGRTQFPVVADPGDTELDQAWLGWSGAGLTLRAGRQRINLDNQRFVGAVGFRQNQQTFDGGSAQMKLGNSTLFYARLTNANRVFGEHHPAPASADLNLNAHLVNYAWGLGPVTAVAYAYLLELENAPAASHRDFGLRVTGAAPLGEGPWCLPFAAEYARQSDHADAPDTVDADYGLVELGLSRESSAAKLGYEVLGGDGTYGFSTPLATLHAFNGWADRFLVTPAAGLRDRYALVSHAIGPYDGALIYHDFVSDIGAVDFGTEWNAAVGKKICPHSSVRIEYADYRAESFGVDTRIVWFTLQAGF